MKLMDILKRTTFTGVERQHFAASSCIAPAPAGLCGIKVVDHRVAVPRITAATLFCPGHLAECYEETEGN